MKTITTEEVVSVEKLVECIDIALGCGYTIKSVSPKDSVYICGKEKVITYTVETQKLEE